MKKLVKKVLLTLFALFLLIQLYQPARNIHEGQAPSDGFSSFYKAPKNIQNILQNSCYDCHSNNTNYPAYSYIQPARYLMEKHIKEGKEELNFDEWTTYSVRKQRNKLNGIIEQIEGDKMPLDSYILLHKNAKLSGEQKVEMINWLNLIQK
ncbi:heme-binding domain-containing protein [Chryseobacterium sp. Ch-15]|uniref:Heme-binding domain-containing protein n=1 Tax=Chryseobacterium muglaense TaxID=2893752 RepID=A0A9Q3YRM4_9FLAO|nr:heme-binding domain-containing protein [Chryseobacterium muglaense]MBD3904982.1 heme-binding domain-containing protein [Chryseobacterium muglaense]MCC9035151.1 heme-binding domain-containing protein [Chryseobacterium muglaense]MCM2554650.1 heme-binding domain-containing protein [Chryseobacterium muglaense]